MTQPPRAASLAAIDHIATLHDVPLTLRYQLTGATERLRLRHPLRFSFPLYGNTVQAEVLYGRTGSCIFFRLDLGALPYTAQAPQQRQQVLALLDSLRRDTDYLAGDITLLRNAASSMLTLRSSAMMAGCPGISDMFIQLGRFAQQARPYLEVLQPLLRR